VTGVSIILMGEELDTGPVLARAQISISEQDTTGSLAVRLSQLAASLLQEVLVGWPKGEITPQPQDEASATYCDPISREAGKIDWHLSAVEIWRRVRAFNPWPGSYTSWRGKQLKIIEAVLLPQTGNPQVGQVVALTPTAGESKAAFGVGTGDGILGVVKVQLEGKQAMPAAEFLRGQKQFIGAILPSG
jgi:methionyl-tRNA formyltransferase